MVLVVLIVRDVVLAVLVVRDDGVLLFHDGALPFVAPHCYTRTRYTRNASSSTSCFECVLSKLYYHHYKLVKHMY